MPLPAAHLPPRPQQFEAAFFEGQRAVRNEQIGIEAVQLAKPIAGAAHSLWTVETEELRAGGLETDAAMRAGIMRRELQLAIGIFRAALFSSLAARLLFGVVSGHSSRGSLTGRRNQQAALTHLQRQFD